MTRLRLNRRALLGTAAIGLGAIALPSRAAARRGPPRIERRQNGVRLHWDGDVTEVRLPLAGVASIVACPAHRLTTGGGFFAAPEGTPPAVRFEERARTLCIMGEGIIVEVGKIDGRLRFLDGNGAVRVAEAKPPAPIPGVAASRRQGFVIGASERLHGLGQFREPVMEYRNRDVFLAQANSDAVNPFLATTGGWGLLWDTGTAAHLRSRGTALDYHSVAGELVRYHVCLGADMDAVIGRYRALTGAAALLPKWAYGYWQSKERYGTQTELTAVVDEYRRRKLPLDAVVLDWRYWGENDQFSGMTFDAKAFPDPRGMTDHVHDRGAHILASVWPAFGTGTAIHAEMKAKGYLFATKHWSGGHVFDASEPEAQAIYWRHIKHGLIDVGIDGLWTDGNEPEFQSTGERYGTSAAFAANGRMAAGPIGENLLTFSYYQAQGLSGAMRRDVPTKRPVILSRSAYAGQQAFGAITWSGDIFSSWGTLTNQIVAAQNFAMAGIPWWTCDIGAFLVFHRYPDGLADPAYKELYVRWFQFGAFLPVFRAHGTHVPRELWQFGAPGDPFYDALEAALRLRYALMPYIYAVAADAALEGGTMLRALAMDFPDDAAARDQDATYMFGRDLLVRIVDRPLFHASANVQEFLPSRAVLGMDGPAATIAFYEGADFERRVSSRLTDDIKMTWSGDLPLALADKPYSVRWTGRIAAEESGRHRFSVMGKGAIRLILDGKMVVDGKAAKAAADGADGAVAFKEHTGDARFTFDMQLEKGRSYAFVLEQRQPTANAVSLWFEWITPSHAAKMTLPAEKTIAIALPRGRDWYDFASGERHRGGARPMVAAPLARHPIFARAGAIIPMAQGLDRTATRPDALTIRVYAGHDGAFVLYDDEGDGQGHLRGEASRIALRWDDRVKMLSIGERKGQYPGMPARQRLNIECIDGSGKTQMRALAYDGTAKTLAF